MLAEEDVDTINFFGLIAFITSFIGMLPQIYRTYILRSASEISTIMLANYLICSGSWVVYGYLTGSSVVVYSNVSNLLCALILLLQKNHYARCV